MHLLDLWGWQYFHTVHFDVCVGPLLWRYLQWIIFKLGVQTNVWICPVICHISVCCKWLQARFVPNRSTNLDRTNCEISSGTVATRTIHLCSGSPATSSMQAFWICSVLIARRSSLIDRSRLVPTMFCPDASVRLILDHLFLVGLTQSRYCRSFSPSIMQCDSIEFNIIEHQ